MRRWLADWQSLCMKAIAVVLLLGLVDRVAWFLAFEFKAQANTALSLARAEATRAALNADGDLLSADEHQRIEALMAQIGQRCDRGDLEALEAATKALAEGTEAFAAERMNRSIRDALAGRSVDQV